jgi:hypothetical protein
MHLFVGPTFVIHAVVNLKGHGLKNSTKFAHNVQYPWPSEQLVEFN